MKAHAMRRSIWFVNVVLMTVLVGIGAWWFLDVREAVAGVPVPGGKRKASQPYLGMVHAFNRGLEGARTDVLRAPVKQAALDDVILRRDYEKKDPTHFIFTGPFPPTNDKGLDRPPGDEPGAPKGLAALGEIDWLVFDLVDEVDNPIDRTMVVFMFDSHKVGYFLVGEFVKESKGKPDRFRITGARSPEEGLYKVDYEIYDAGMDEPVGTGEIEWDKRTGLVNAENSPVYERVASAAPAGEPDDAATEFVRPESVKRAAELTGEDLKPKITWVNSRLVKIEFDGNTRRYFLRKGAKEKAESIKTRIAKDKRGNTIGLRLMDPGDVPADVLQLRRGDVIVSVDGKPVKERAGIVRIAEGLREDTSRVTLVIDRNGVRITLHVDPRDNATRRVTGAYVDRAMK